MIELLIGLAGGAVAATTVCITVWKYVSQEYHDPEQNDLWFSSNSNVPQDLQDMARFFDIDKARERLPRLTLHQAKVELHRLRAACGSISSIDWLNEFEIEIKRSLLL